MGAAPLRAVRRSALVVLAAAATAGCFIGEYGKIERAAGGAGGAAGGAGQPGTGGGVGGGAVAGAGGAIGTGGSTGGGGEGSPGGAAGASPTGGDAGTAGASPAGGSAGTSGASPAGGSAGTSGASLAGGSAGIADAGTGGATAGGAGGAGAPSEGGVGGEPAAGGTAGEPTGAGAGGVAGVAGTAGGPGGVGGEGGFAGAEGGTSGAGAVGGISGAGGHAGQSGSAGAGGAAGASVGSIPEGPSCYGRQGDECDGESCCKNFVVPGGTFPMGRGTETCDGCCGTAGAGGACSVGCPANMNCATYSQYWNETPEHVATVSSFALDKYEVTVSRFRAFVEAGGGTQASPPAAGSGAHPLIGNSGWDSAWNTSLAANQAALTANVACNPGPFQTWTPTAGANEEQPMSCVTWYEAFAFCIWDGGRLPSDAEWEYVAAGGDENRLYPWGSDSSVPLPATYSYFNYPGFIDVGSHSGGNGRWGHSDLAGSVHEWLLDWYDLNWYGTTAGGCTNCANLTPGSNRKTRSGSINSAAADIRVAFMGSASPASRFGDLGFRCARDPVPEGDSCAQMVGDECNGESCCTNAVVPDGTFPMGRGTEVCNGAGGAGGAGGGCIDGCPTGMDCSIYSNEQPEHPATVSAYALDKYEVTVGRFRAFVEADGGTQLNPPAPGSGAHPLIGSSGWESAWNAELPTNRTELEDRITCNAAQQTWTSIAEANEQYPMNCVSWFEAFAFCIWDGGRLPTEAEWEYAAAGGDENRLYPWGNDFLEPLPANYAATNDSPLVNVGSHEDGNGRWGHADLAGSMNEWVLDWYDYQYYPSVQSGCSNCVNLTPAIQGSWRVLRGGYWYNDADRLRAAGFRDCSEPYIRMTTSGWRCSRTP